MSESSEVKLLFQPKVPELAATFRTKEDVVAAMFDFPDYSILPETDQQRDALDSAKVHFKFVHLWLHYRLLGRLDYYDTLYGNPLTLLAKPYADLSVATLDFCSHIYSRLRPEGVDSFEQLWGICEYSKSLGVLRATNYYGDYALSNKHQILKASIIVQQAYAQMEQGNLVTETVSGFDPKEHITETLLEAAINYANVEPIDQELKAHIYKYRQAIAHYYNLTLKKTKGFAITQVKESSKCKTKRGRGRPPKQM